MKYEYYSSFSEEVLIKKDMSIYRYVSNVDLFFLDLKVCQSNCKKNFMNP